MTIDVVGYIYAAAVAAGGIIGFVKAGSTPSLMAGLVFGSALTYGAYEASKQPPYYLPQMISSCVLGSMMTYRFINTGKFMPAGLIAAFSIVIILRNGYGYYYMNGIRK